MTLLMILQVRTTIEDRVMIFFYIFLSYGLGIVIKKWQVFLFFLSGCGRRCTLIVGNYFSHNLRIFPVGYKIKKENHNLHIFQT